MSSSLHIAAVSVLTLVLAPVPLRGQLITFRFEGRVTDVYVDIPDYLGTPNIDWPDLGTPFTGFYTFDPTAPDTAGSAEQGAYHVVLDDLPAVDVSVGDLRLQGTSSAVATYASIYEAGDWIPSIELVSHPEGATLFNRQQLSIVHPKRWLATRPYSAPRPASYCRPESATLSLWIDSGLNTRPWPYVSIAATLDSLTAVRPGDYNGSGTVDAADYALWRERDGSQHGYDTWRANFGKTVEITLPSNGSNSVPEPATCVLLLIACASSRQHVAPCG